jgi:hypothetical protein
MTPEHDCLPNLDNGRARPTVRPVAIIVILAMTMAFTVVVLAMKMTPVVAVGLLAAACGWTIRLSRRVPGLRRGAVR